MITLGVTNNMQIVVTPPEELKMDFCTLHVGDTFQWVDLNPVCGRTAAVCMKVVFVLSERRYHGYIMLNGAAATGKMRQVDGNPKVIRLKQTTHAVFER